VKDVRGGMLAGKGCSSGFLLEEGVIWKDIRWC